MRDDAEPKPINDPERIAWVRRIQEGSIRYSGSFSGPKIEREAPEEHDQQRLERPFVRRHEPAERKAVS